MDEQNPLQLGRSPAEPTMEQDGTDPDPFLIGLGIFGAMAGGAQFLETRRQRQFMERQQREQFRAAWFAARRTLIHFQQAVDETYMLEDAYDGMNFRIGAVRISVSSPNRHQALRRLKGQTLTTANFMSDTLDELSNFLGPEDQEPIDRILRHLESLDFPDRYADLIPMARGAIELYGSLLNRVAEREEFESRAG